MKLPQVMGRRGGAGVVAEVGKLVKKLKPGDRVLIRDNGSCGHCRFCRNGREHYCENDAMRGGFSAGFMAEYALAPERTVNALPSEVSFDQAIGIIAAAVGYRALKVARVKPAETVIVTAATGGTGASTVLCALTFGVARIIAVARSPERTEKLRAVSPRRIIPLTGKESLAERIMEATDGRGANALVDFIPNDPATFEAALECVQRGGRIVPMGRSAQSLRVSLDRLTRNGWEVLGSTAAHLSDLGELIELVRFGALDLSPMRMVNFSLERANEALQMVLDRPGHDLFCVGITINPD
jgi:threonine dehydrogenase-like Zn-dependent dehydrogenase